jgi:DNA-binding protein HU-beta
MNKTELVQDVVERTGLLKKDVAAVVDGVFNAITDSVSKKEKVVIVGFGTFLTRERSPRSGRNPHTGKEIAIPGKIVPAFKPGKGLKDVANSGAPS